MLNCSKQKAKGDVRNFPHAGENPTASFSTIFKNSSRRGLPAQRKKSITERMDYRADLNDLKSALPRLAGRL